MPSNYGGTLKVCGLPVVLKRSLSGAHFPSLSLQDLDHAQFAEAFAETFQETSPTNSFNIPGQSGHPGELPGKYVFDANPTNHMRPSRAVLLRLPPSKQASKS